MKVLNCCTPHRMLGIFSNTDEFIDISRLDEKLVFLLYVQVFFSAIVTTAYWVQLMFLHINS
jgi:hypothetical protein